MTDPRPSPDADLPWDTLVAQASAYADRAPRVGHPTPTSAWTVDLEAGTLIFTDGSSTRSVPVQVAGTHVPDDHTWMWGWEHSSVPDELAVAANRLRAYGERHHRSDLTTSPVPADEELARGYAAVAAYLAGARGVFRATSGRTVAYLLVDGAAPRGDGRDVTAADLVPAPALERPQLAGASGIPLVHDALTGPVPEFTSEQAIAVVVSYLRQLHPLHHLARDDNPSVAVLEQRTAAQEALRQAFWRRTDDAHDGARLGFDRAYDVETMSQWDACEVGPRLWQVTFVRETAGGEVGEGYLVMLFDDAPQLVDRIVAG